MTSIIQIIGLNTVWEGNVEAILHFVCGSGHMIHKHVTTPQFECYGGNAPVNVMPHDREDGTLGILTQKHHAPG